MIKINHEEIMETINMINGENLDIRTITMGISLLDCTSDSLDTLCTKIYDKITKSAEKLVLTGETIVTITNEESVRTMVWSLFSLFPAAIALVMGILAYKFPIKK